MPETIETLLSTAKQWCDGKRGRRSELARVLGVSRQAVSDWFKDQRTKTPTADQALKLQDFLRHRRRKMSRDIGRMSKAKLDALNELGRKYRQSLKPAKVESNQRAKAKPRRKGTTIGASC